MVGRKNYPLETVLNAGGVLADILTAFREKLHIDADVTVPLLEAEMKSRCVVELPTHGPDPAEEWALMQELSLLSGSKTPKYLPLYRAAIARVGGDTNVLWFGKAAEADAVFCAWQTALPTVERVLVLDGTADHETYKALLGDDVHIERIHIEQNIEIVQAQDLPIGKRKLTDPNNDGILAQAVALARSMGAGFISNKAAMEIARTRGYLPEGYPTGHFNALRGVNCMESLDALVIAGRPEPDALAVEAVARALWPREALTLTGAYRWGVDGIASVASHPDARCDGLLRSFREAEINQAIGRLRAVRSPTCKHIFLLTHTPTGLPVKSRLFAEIVLPVPMSRLLIAGGGVAPLAKELMSKLCPELWATPDRAKEWLKWNLKGALTLYKYIYKANAPFKFRLEGQKRHSLALSWRDDFDTWNGLEKLAGKKVVECQRVISAPAPAVGVTEFTESHKPDVAPVIQTHEPPVIRRPSTYSRLLSTMGKYSRTWKPRRAPPPTQPPPWRDWLTQIVPEFTHPEFS